MEEPVNAKELMKSLRTELKDNVAKRKELQQRNNEIVAKLKELKRNKDDK